MAVKFNGTTDGLSIQGARSQFQNVAGGTIACWARLETAPTGGVVVMKFSNGVGANQTRVSLGLTSALQLEVGCRILDAASLADHIVALGTPPAVGEWHHYAVCFVFTNRSFALYYDGALVNTTTMTSQTAGNTSNTASLTAGIACGNPPGGGNAFWPGSIDDMVIYNRALGPGEILSMYTSRGRDFILQGISGRWTLAEGNNGVAVAQAADVTGLGGLATPIGSPVYGPGVCTYRRKPRTAIGHR